MAPPNPMMLRLALLALLLWPTTALGQESPPRADAKQAKTFCEARTGMLHTGGIWYDTPGQAFEKVAVEALARRGVTMVGERPDVLLRLDRLQTSESTVQLKGGGRAVTSTTIKGRLSLEAPGVKPYRVSFKGTQYGPWRIASYNFYRKGNVSGDAFRDGYARAIQHLFDFCAAR